MGIFHHKTNSITWLTAVAVGVPCMEATWDSQCPIGKTSPRFKRWPNFGEKMYHNKINKNAWKTREEIRQEARQKQNSFCFFFFFLGHYMIVSGKTATLHAPSNGQDTRKEQGKK